MKKLLFSLVLIVTATMCLSSCSESDEEIFGLSPEVIYGHWVATDVLVDGKWVDITNPIYKSLGVSITFNKDKTFRGDGYFGTGSGTYEFTGKKTITTYLNKEVYAVYTIKSINGNTAVISMAMDNSSIDMKVKKL